MGAESAIQDKHEKPAKKDDGHLPIFDGQDNPWAKLDKSADNTRSISNVNKVATDQELGKAWKDAASQASPADQASQFTKLNGDIARRAGAMAGGGAQAIGDFETKLNAELKDVKGGPTLNYDDKTNKLTITHYREITSNEAAQLQKDLKDGKISQKDLAAAGYINATGSDGQIGTYKPMVKPETFDLSKYGKADVAKPQQNDASDKVKDVPAWGDKVPGAGSIPPSPYVFAALTESLKNDLKMNVDWKAENAPQKEILGQSASLGPEVDNLRKLGLLDGVAQKGDVDKVNAMFAKYGLPIHFDKAGDDAITAGGVFNFKANWNGTETKMTANDANGKPKEFDAFEKSVKSFNVDGKTVIEVYRDKEKGITMYMTPTDGDLKGYAAYKQAMEMTPGANTPSDSFNKAIIPKMKVRDEGDVPQLVGLKTNGYSVNQARIATSVDIDQSGAEIKQGLGMQMTRSIAMPAPAFKMDKPPLVWVMQDGASKPLIAFRVTQEAWTDPKKN